MKNNMNEYKYFYYVYYLDIDSYHMTFSVNKNYAKNQIIEGTSRFGGDYFRGAVEEDVTDDSVICFLFNDIVNGGG